MEVSHLSNMPVVMAHDTDFWFGPGETEWPPERTRPIRSLQENVTDQNTTSLHEFVELSCACLKFVKAAR